MTSVGLLESFLPPVGKKVRHEKRNRPTSGDFDKVFETDVEVRRTRRRLKREDLADDAKNVLFALLGRDKELDVIGEDDQADSVVV